ncbi:Transmembrane protease serine 3 [Pseudolycoriella hygida]|uniref:Transmembrane protease serine 3 n=1 Tax=Pseudolycoriella hygida TaxID=35572 RepID=A0A9Q0N5K9_9DIPT|nr:Transmembrane protease serine 3 [Pseudolycoriella hygida]
MLRNTLVVLLAVFTVTAKCELDTNIVPSMVGGSVSLEGQAPSVVSIRVPRQAPNAPETFCQGTIINLNHILTSCQCVHNETNNLINPAWFRIIAGDLNIVVPSYRRFSTTASHIYTHPGYTISPRTNDIAVMRTTTSFPAGHNTIDWAPRNTHVLRNGLPCVFFGWGAATVTGVLNPVQQSIPAPILERNDCNAANVHRGLVIDNMICAGSLAATPNVCTGNLGGGLFCPARNTFELTGILSFGLGCGTANIPGVYTQVRFFEQWINQQLTRTDATPAGTLVAS